MTTLSAPEPAIAQRPKPADAVKIPDQLALKPWNDPILDQFGHDARSAYVERFWLSVLGPSATWFLRFAAAGFEDHPDGFDIDTDDTARQIGIGTRNGRHAPFARTVERVGSFGMARLFDAGTLVVRHRIPPLTQRQLARLPRRLRDEHDGWAAPRPAQPGVEDMKRRSRALALSLLELGEDDASVERQLHRWQFHPALAHEAIRWARDEHQRRVANQASTSDV